MERKYDLICFVFGDAIFIIFFLLLLFSNLEQVPSLLSSLVIAELTLALVWVELSKRPELKLLDFIPIIHSSTDTSFLKVGYNIGQLSSPSRFLGIREASDMNFINDAKFGERFSFTVDLANIGYAEIMVHEYVEYIDGIRQRPMALVSQSNPQERLILRTQQRHTIDMSPLYVQTSGFHKLSIEVLATTAKCSKEIWFFISEDFQRLRYVEMYPLKRLLSPLIKAKLKAP